MSHIENRQIDMAVRTASRVTDRLLLSREVASQLNCHIRTVWKLKAIGTLPAVKIAGTSATRFRQSDVDRLLVSSSGGGGALR